MSKKQLVLDGKYIIYPFGKWWIAQDSQTKRAVTKSTSRDELIENLKKVGA